MMQQLEHNEVELGGVNVHYVRMGAGPPVVLIHGLNASWFTWCRNLEPLARAGYTVFAPDLPGHGDSDKPRDLSYNPAAGARVVNDFLEVLGLTKAVIVGNSAGGLVGGLFALQHPAKVERLVLVAAAGLGREVGWILRLAALPLVGESIYRTPFYDMFDFRKLLFHRPPPFLDQILPELRRVGRLPGARRAFLRSIRSGINLFGQRKQNIILDRLGGLPVPLLTVWGSEDALIPVAQAQEVRRVLPQSIVQTIPECGHWPHMEQDTQFNELLTRFLRGDLDRTGLSGQPAS